MQVLEWMGKSMFSRYGIAIPKGRVVDCEQKEQTSAGEFSFPLVIKAQVPVGGRGKAGAVRLVSSAADFQKELDATFSATVKGLQAKSVLVEEVIKVEKELYIAITVDYDGETPILLLSSEGGVDIEQTSASDPGKIIKIPVDPYYGLLEFQVAKAGRRMGLTHALCRQLGGIAQKMYRLFTERELLLVEINPLGVLSDGSLLAMDSKISLDESAAERYADLMEFYQKTEPKTKSDRMKAEYKIDYVELTGEIGLISGGAGMTMSAMDMIADAGAKPACFMDCSNNATSDGYRQALLTVLENKNVKSVLINIFGGLTQMDLVAEALVQVFQGSGLPQKPVIIRIEGTNCEKGKALLREKGLTTAEGFRAAIESTVKKVSQ